MTIDEVVEALRDTDDVNECPIEVMDIHIDSLKALRDAVRELAWGLHKMTIGIVDIPQPGDGESIGKVTSIAEAIVAEAVKG